MISEQRHSRQTRPAAGPGWKCQPLLLAFFGCLFRGSIQPKNLKHTILDILTGADSLLICMYNIKTIKKQLIH